jgi:hypothetical protein
MNKKAQQEMVGFVLIVIIVIIALMIFLIFSLRGGNESQNSLEASNMIDSIFKMTTDCAPVFEPDYNDFEDLFKTCYTGGRCNNIKKDACTYLNEILSDVLEQMVKTQATVNSYTLDFYKKEGEGLLRISKGNCTGNTFSALKSISKDSQILNIRLKICKG